MQILENGEKAKEEIYDELFACDIPTVRAQLLLVLYYMDWFEGNLYYAQKTAIQLIEFGNQENLNIAKAHGHGFLGLCYFLQMSTKKAMAHFENTYMFRNYGLQVMVYPILISAMRLYAEEGLWDEYEKLVSLSEKQVLSEAGKRLNKIYLAEQANINFGLINKQHGLAWAKENDYTSFIPINSQHSPELVQAKILVLDETLESWELAQKILNQMIPFLEARNNINYALRAYVIQAVVLYKIGDTVEAYNFLNKALNISESRNFIRPYIELGECMKTMLLEVKHKYPEHIENILHYFSKELSSAPQLILSRREKEILFLIDKLSNKEIANQLFIAETTVKRHVANIFQKLHANNRREALVKAKELQIVD